MRVTRFVVVCLIVGIVATAALGQTPGREFRKDTKTAAGGYATSLDFEIPLKDLESAERTIRENIELLREVTAELGFTFTGTAQLELEISMDTRPQGLTAAHIRLFIAEKPTDEELGGDFDIDVVKLEEVTVAYTYHRGSLDGMQLCFIKLGQWALGQDLSLVGFPRIVVNLGDDDFPLEVQMPVEVE